MSRTDGPLKVIYITGFAHNGSTLLDAILGNHPDVLSAGEIIHFPYGLSDQTHRCGCGRLVKDCPVWHDVLPQWSDKTGETNLQSYTRLATAYARRSNQGRMIRGAARGSAEFRRFSRDTTALLELLKAASGQPVIVDSSKPAPRGLALSLIPEIDLRVVHLVRDVRGAAWSFLRRRLGAGGLSTRYGLSVPFSLRVALGWNLANRSANRLRERLGSERSALIRYEDLVADPTQTLAQICALCGLEPDGLPASMWQDGIPNKGHIMWGNPNREQRVFSLKLDASWQESLPMIDQRMVMALSGRMMRKYHYG